MEKFEHEQLVGALKKKLEGQFLNWKTDQLWKVDTKAPLGAILKAIHEFLPASSTLYFEGLEIHFDVVVLFQQHQVSNPASIGQDTLSPQPDSFHVPNSDALMDGLIKLAEQHPCERLFYHMKAYGTDALLLWWHDASDGDPMLLTSRFSEELVSHFAHAVGGGYAAEAVPDPARHRAQTEAFLAMLERNNEPKHPLKKWWKRLMGRIS